MISTPDRKYACTLIDEAIDAGARQALPCQELGLTARTFRRWTRAGAVRADGRPIATRPPPGNRLSEAERARVLATCHRPEFASLPPGQILPRLADEGDYLASESTFYRVLRAHGEQPHRGRSQAPRPNRPPASHRADGPCQLWSWDITYLPGPVKDVFFYLYLVVDLYSRKIVGWEVHDSESGEQAGRLIEQTVWREGCTHKPLVLHSDNGSPMKAATFRVTLEKLGITPSYSRPRVSNDNPYSESVFRTFKYRPAFPINGFADLKAAREYVYGFVDWYNQSHGHSAIRHVTLGPTACRRGHGHSCPPRPRLRRRPGTQPGAVAWADTKLDARARRLAQPRA
jgi:transposase InsO family protein